MSQHLSHENYLRYWSITPTAMLSKQAPPTFRLMLFILCDLFGYYCDVILLMSAKY